MRFRTLNFAIGGLGVVALLAAILVGSGSTAQLLGSAMLGWIVANILFLATKNGSSRSQSINKRRSTPPFPRLLMVLLLAVICAGYFAGRRGQPVGTGDLGFWSFAFGASWYFGQRAQSDGTKISFLALVFWITVLCRAETWFSYQGGPIGVDPWVHEALASYIKQTGFLAAQTEYGPFPILHISVAQVSLITGLDVTSSLFLVGAVPLSALTSLAYLVGVRLAGHQAGVTSSVLAAIVPDLVQWGVILTPMSLAIFLAAMVTYVALRRSPKLLGLGVVALVALTLTHTLVTLMIVTLFFVATFTMPIVRRLLDGNGGKGSPSSGLLILSATLMISYWMFASGVFPFIIRGLEYGLNVDRFSLPDAESVFGWQAYFYRLAESIVVMLATVWTIGALRGAMGEKTLPLGFGLLSNARIVHFLAIAAGYAAIAAGLLAGPFSALLPPRWTALGIFLLAPVSGAAFSHALGFSKPSRQKVGAVLIIAATLLMSTHPLVLATPIPELSDQPRRGFLVSERAAATWIDANLVSPFSTDVYFRDVFYGINQTAAGSSAGDASRVLQGQAPPDGWIVYRTEFDENQAFVSQPNIVTWSSVRLDRSTTDHIVGDAAVRAYDNGMVIVVDWTAEP